MAYAEIEDVRSRAGILSEAWATEGTDVDESDLQRFLETSADEINGSVAALGITVPITDTIAAKSLVGYNADKALLLAIPATWPGGGGPDEVRDLLATIKARVAVADAALATGKFSAILILEKQGQSGGSSNFWEKEPTYDYVRRWEESWLVSSPSLQPQAHKGMRF